MKTQINKEYRGKGRGKEGEREEGREGQGEEEGR